MKVEETDWVDISADLADVNDDNTHQDSSQQEDDEETLILEEPGDDDDDSDGGDGVMELDDGSEKFMYYINFDIFFFAESNSRDIPADDFALETQSEGLETHAVFHAFKIIYLLLFSYFNCRCYRKSFLFPTNSSNFECSRFV